MFRTSATPVTDLLANVAHTEAGPWTRTLTVPAKGTYQFKVGGCVIGAWLQRVPSRRTGGVGENMAAEGSAAQALIKLLPSNCRWWPPTFTAPSRRKRCPTNWWSACLMHLPWLAQSRPLLAKRCSGGAPQSQTASSALSEQQRYGGGFWLKCTRPAQCLSRLLLSTAVCNAAAAPALCDATAPAHSC